MSSTEADISRRINLSWAALNKPNKIWRSELSRTFKTKLFCSTVESVLLYGCESWTLTTETERKIDGCYTKLLRSALGYRWQDHITNETLYGKLPKVTSKIRQRRLRLAGHCQRHPEEAAHRLTLWKPSNGQRKRGKPAMSYVMQLEKDTGLGVDDIKNQMADRDIWRQVVGRGDEVPPT